MIIIERHICEFYLRKRRYSLLLSEVNRYVRPMRPVLIGALVYTLVILVPLLVVDEALAADTTIQLTNSDRLTGVIIERTNSTIIMEHPSLGKVVIPLDDIDQTSLVQLREESKNIDWPSEKVAMAAEETNQPLKKPDIREYGFLRDMLFPGWKRHVGVGLSGSSGNSDTIDVSAVFGAKFEDDKKRWDLSSTYFFGKTNGKTYKGRFNNFLTRDWLFMESPWFVTAHGRYEFSKFEDWDHRLGLFVGPGYQFIKNEEFSLLSRLGLGVTRTFGGEDDDWSPELNLELEGNWAISNYHQIELKTQVLPNIGDLGEFRAIASLVWVTRISEDGAFKLNLGIRNEYDSESSEDIKNNDFDYYARVGYDF